MDINSNFLNKPSKYEVEFLKVADADAILIREYISDIPYVILIDAGNVGDGNSVIIPHIKKYYNDIYDANKGKYIINLAICTHPDSDHKGGFFDLLYSEEIEIGEFGFTDPANYLTSEDIKRYRNEDNASKAVRKIFNNPNDENENLIELAMSKNVNDVCAIDNKNYPFLHLKVIGPTEDYYKEVVKDMVSKYGVETYDESDTRLYDKNAKVDEEEAKSVIDEDDDPSPFNASSLILLFEPQDGDTFLFAGDTNCASLTMAIRLHPEIKGIKYFKVPHHGSKHNLNTKIISDLVPQCSIISAKGTRMHPNSAIVHWLSKEGNVYSTHILSDYLRIASCGYLREGNSDAQILKHKQ